MQDKYLLLLTTKIQGPNTTFTYMEQFQKLSKAMRMEYINITVDIEKALSAYKFL